MRIDNLGRLPPHMMRQLLDLLNAAFLAEAVQDLFADKQEVRVLHTPHAEIRASTHFMRFRPGLKQPLHRHSGDRLLVTIGSSRLDVFSAPDEFGIESAHKYSLPANTIGAIAIPSGAWHWFETSKSGRGAAAFSFHPFDDIDPGSIGPTGLMQQLTEFSRDR